MSKRKNRNKLTGNTSMTDTPSFEEMPENDVEETQGNVEDTQEAVVNEPEAPVAEEVAEDTSSESVAEPVEAVQEDPVFEPAPVVEVAPVEEAPAPVEAPKADTPNESDVVINLRANLAEYAEAMAKGKTQNTKSLVENQNRLFHIINGAFTAPDDLRRDAVNAVYQAFRDNANGAFAETATFRGLRDLATINLSRGKALRAILRIIHETLDGRIRQQVLQQHDFGPLFKDISDLRLRQGVMAYLGVAL